MPSPLTLSARRACPRTAVPCWSAGRGCPPRSGPSVVGVRGAEAVDLTRSYPTVSQLLNVAGPADVRAAMRTAPSLGPIDGHRRQQRRGTARPVEALAARAVRPARGQGERRDVRREPARARDRGAGAGQPGAGRRACGARSRPSSGPTCAASSPAPPKPPASRTCWSRRACGRSTSRSASAPTRSCSRKCPPMAAVGLGARVGIHPASVWNNPEPELVLVVNRAGAIVAVSLGNDVNLRDVEGRSALLLGRAKDNNASCAIGPFFRLLDDALHPGRRPPHRLRDGRRGRGRLPRRAHDPGERDQPRPGRPGRAGASAATTSIPDGLVLFIGTMFTPLDDRGAPGSGFTHKVGDVVSIASPDLGTLVNEVVHLRPGRAVDVRHRRPHGEPRPPRAASRRTVRDVSARPAIRQPDRCMPAAFEEDAYPFTDPAVSPCTMYFWKISTSSTAGSAPRKPEAAITE